MSNKVDFDMEGSGTKKKGVYCSTCCVWTTVVFVIAALLAEGIPCSSDFEEDWKIVFLRKEKKS